MEFKLIILISLILKIRAEVEVGQESCYVENGSPYSSFGGIMSYLSSRGSKIYVPPNCTPIFVWGIIRHGTRYPTKMNFIKNVIKILPEIRDKILQNHKQGRGSLCKKDLENLNKWKTHLTPNLIAQLTTQGVKEMVFLAEKMKEAFPTLLKSQSKNNFTFQRSQTNRTRDSALAFTNELMETNFSTTSGNNITKDDKFLRLYQHCPKYREFVENPALFKEVNLFKTSALWQKITAEISLRLGFLQPLANDNITLMYNMCAYENAWNADSKPPFCAAFSSEDLKIMEYYKDLHLYYKSGYGNAPFIENMGCSIVRDMIQTLSNATNNTGYARKGKFLFSHAEAVVPTMVKLGLYKDNEELKLENYQKMMEKRKWKTAFFNVFASNIIATLYKCPGRNDSQNVVIIHLNERPVVVPKCSQDPCTLEELQTIFQDVLDENQCNTKFCEGEESLNASLGYSFFVSSNNFIVIICFLLIFKDFI